MSDHQISAGCCAAHAAQHELSRRDLLQQGGTLIAAVGAAATLAAASATAAEKPGKAAVRGKGRKFKAWLHRKVEIGYQGGVEELTLRPVTGRMVVVRTEAAQCCYSNAGQFMGVKGSVEPLPIGLGLLTPLPNQAMILGHGGVGVVESVGPEVKRVRPGDRVIVGVTPQCGECYNCVRGRADWCLAFFAALNVPSIPIADTADGVEVTQATNIGGHAELMVTPEEWCTRIDSTAPAAELALLSCVGSSGLGATTTIAPVAPGSSVVVFGAGPVGLSAIQGARIRGAAQIIAVEPIKARRELALKVGATVALDPNAEGAKLLDRIRELCRGDATIFSGQKTAVPGDFGAGPDFIVQAVGGDRARPTVESGPDPTGLLPLKQAWELCPLAGTLVTLGINQNGEISLHGDLFALWGRTHHASNYGGTNLKRDVPRYAKLLDLGQYDAKSIVGQTYGLERTDEAFQAVLDRSVVNATIIY